MIQDMREGAGDKKSETLNDKNGSRLSLTCPFYKEDERKHHKCLQFQSSGIRDVKQHPSRNTCNRVFVQAVTGSSEPWKTKDGIQGYAPTTSDSFTPLTESPKIHRRTSLKEYIVSLRRTGDMLSGTMPSPESPVQTPHVCSLFHEVAASFLRFCQARRRCIHLNRLRSDSALRSCWRPDEGRIRDLQEVSMNDVVNQFIEASVPVSRERTTSDNLSGSTPGPLIRKIGVDDSSFVANKQGSTGGFDGNVGWILNTDPIWDEVSVIDELFRGGSLS
ncbi:hypothetical protein CDEST_02626 [Colletotrichum destructivum]|uniref:Uncharacterized protein n=1 Tax=Colletotrichum destructivum TaxID=34406 RepID=A0AAX4I3A4_9PEZI|nr:hypothetical protein CDEST_02626 [Colletotrichum destructivum]